MVKPSTSSSRKSTLQLKSEICAHKSLRANLGTFVRKLNQRHQHLTTKEYLVKIHNFISNFKTLAKKTTDLNKPAYDFVRICKHCGNWKKRSRLVECVQCEDYYHRGCLERGIEDLTMWMCPSCVELGEMIDNKQKYLDRHYGMAPKTNKKCRKCKQDVEKELTTCMKCNHHFHHECFDEGKKDQIVCSDCHQEIEEQIKNRKSLIQRKLEDYYDVKSDSRDSRTWQKSEESTMGFEQLTMTYSHPFNLKPIPTLSQRQIEYYKKELLYAIYSKQMEYSEELVFEAQQPADLSFQDPTLEVISKKDQKAYLEYKRQPIGPYSFVLVEGMGYDVRADMNIPKGTIICEYIGEVITKRKALEFVDNDSLMELSPGMDADSSLIIRPQRFTNMARFINGVNNKSAASMKKANVETIRLSIGGRPTVLLFTRRKVLKGESLAYDYNAGGLDKFPTGDFL